MIRKPDQTEHNLIKSIMEKPPPSTRAHDEVYTACQNTGWGPPYDPFGWTINKGPLLIMGFGIYQNGLNRRINYVFILDVEVDQVVSTLFFI